MAKKRVHEVAKELGYTSKEVLVKLQEMGEFVKAASSTIEPPAEKRLRAALPIKVKDEPKTAKPVKEEEPKDTVKKTIKPPKPGTNRTVTKKKGAAKTIEDINLDDLDPQLRAEAERLRARRQAENIAAAPTTPKRPAPRPPAARQAGGNNPFSSAATAPVEGERSPSTMRRVTAKPGAMRSAALRPPSNNTLSSKTSRHSSGERSGGRGRHDGGGVSQGGGARTKPGQRPSSGGARPAGRSSGPSSGAQGRGQGPVGGGFGKGSRGRGGTQGAFGRGGFNNKKQRKSKRTKRQELEQLEAPVIGGVSIVKGDGSTLVRMRRGATINDFAEKINVDPAALITVLFHLGEMATATQSLDEDTFALLGAELGYDVQIFSSEDEDKEILEQFDIDLEAEAKGEGDDVLQQRPPVVTVMGHVDHGKTRLLDAIRHTSVVDDEHGGITQHIGAYQIHCMHEGQERAITFVDTPGHEAFTAMRARGAKVTDIAILVVAADDGVMPQTIEALNHAQAAKVPVVVALNKIDKEGADPQRVMGQLTEYGLVAEEYGGDTMFVNVSAKEGRNIDELLEAVLLAADATLDLRANPNKAARGVAIEAHLDKGRGAVTTVLVQSGTLKVGDSMVVGSAHGRVRAMFDDDGSAIETAAPSRPVQMLGLSSVPRAGDSFLVTVEERAARQIAEKRETAERSALLAKRRKRINLEALNDAIAEGKIDTLNLILKGDASGAVEALEDALLQIDVGEGVGLRVIHRGVGAITQNDVNLATVDNAVIIGFNVRPAERVADLADKEGIDTRFYNVIYAAIDDIEASLKGMLKPEFEEQQQGSAEIREIFSSSKFGNVAGSMVHSGVIKRHASARVVRDGIVVGDNVMIDTLRRFKNDAVEVKEGYECGIGLGSFNDINVGDVIETFEMVEMPRS